MIISGSRRPQWSAMIPKMIAPSGRIARATVSVNAISGRVRPKDLAMSSMTSVRMKKSNASSVQPRKPASTAFHWFVRSTFVIGAAAAAVAMIVREGYPTSRPRLQPGLDAGVRVPGVWFVRRDPFVTE